MARTERAQLGLEMDQTGRLDLPLILPSQAQKHVTHNEALTLLDGLIHLVIKSSGDLAPPVSAVTDDAFLVGSPASSAWFGQEGRIALNTDAGWRFAAAVPGMIAFFASENELRLFDDGTWTAAGEFLGSIEVATLGVNTTADVANRLAVRSNAALFTAILSADGGNGDMQIKVNKETAADTASVLLQSAFSGRAEIGLSGNNNLAIKVSPDGTVWHNAIVIDNTDGLVSLSDNSVGNAALADMLSARIKGRISAGSGNPEDLTAAQLTSLADLFTSTLKGLVPASGGGSSSYLRADGVWAAPPGGSGGVSQTDVDFGATPVFAKTFSFAHAGAAPGQNVLMSASADMPGGLSMDELEMDAFTASAFVSSAGTIMAVITAFPGPVTGLRNFNYTLS